MNHALLSSTAALVVGIFCAAAPIANAQCPGTRGNGDLDGDRVLSTQDLQVMYTGVFENKPLTTCQAFAADLDLNGNVDPADVQCAYEFIFGYPSCIRHLGDANGDGKTTAKADCSLIRKFISGEVIPTDVEKYRADVAPDGKLSLVDLMCMTFKEHATYRYDMNSDFRVDAKDAYWLFDFFLEKVSYPKDAKAACTGYLGDLDNDGSVTPGDAQELFAKLSAQGISVTLPQ